MIIAHVSDIHIGGSDASVERAMRVRDHINGLPQAVDAIVATGDIADHALVEEYEIAREALTFNAPTIVCPGNHDVRAEFRKVLLGMDGDGPVNQVLRLPGLTIALCDSSIPPRRNEGFLEDETLAWLESVLAAEDGPVFVGMHHPPVTLGMPYVDGIMLTNPEALESILRRHPQVKAVLVGHAHTGAASTFADRPLVVAPGVVSTALLPIETEGGIPVSYDLPPAYTLHVFDNDRLTSHVRAVP
ncbi:metallophosphoesterase [Streptosporangiaceae bacterium NEAU-GS5]|nr:metallophosphoesterase [Streptosporangiaceae bacterium NEAU-GS5]